MSRRRTRGRAFAFVRPARGRSRVRRASPRRGVRGVLATVALGLVGIGVQGGLPNAFAQEGGANGGTDAADAVEDVGGFARRGYVGIGAGVTRLEPESPTDSLSVDDESSAGVHVYAGYDLTRWLSTELYFADLGEAGIDFLGSDVGDVGYRVYGINAVAYLYHSGTGFGPTASDPSALAARRGLSLFLTAGVGGLENDSDLDYRRDHGAHASFGGGLEYGFGSGIALRAELQSYDADAQYASLSVLKRFGGARAPEPVAPVEPITAAPVNEPAPVDPPAPRPVASPSLYFPFDSETLTAESRARLDAFVDEVRDTDLTLALGGHTDSTGPERYNLALSERRANAVRDYLVGRGVPASRLDARGYGEADPVSPNSTARGRAENRRAEVRLQR